MFSMLRLLLFLGLNAAMFWVLDHYILIDYFSVSGSYEAYVLIGFIFAVLNLLVKPILSLLTFPLHFISLGLSTFILNGVLLWGLQQTLDIVDLFGAQISISEWWIYILAGTLLSLGNSVSEWIR